MIIRIKERTIKQAGFVLVSTLIVVAAMLGVTITTESVIAGNTTNQTVIARVNVSNTEPTLYKVEIEDPLDSFGNINIEVGTPTIVICNGTFQDVNGYDDIVSVNATLYSTSVASDASDHNNTHYTNSSCLEGGQDCTQVPGEANNGSCICQFAVQYYADPGNWQCNMTIKDSGGLTSTKNSSAVNLNEILGIAIETTTLDFGNLSVSQTSDPTRQNVTNVGNVPINVTVRGYGGDNETVGQNLSMICDPSAGALANITFDYMRFNTINSTPYADMINITNQTRQIADLTIPRRTHTIGGYGNTSNSTFWRLQIPLGASGICNGTVIFGAINALNN